MFNPTKELVDKWIEAVKATRDEYFNGTHECGYSSCKYCALVTSPDAPEDKDVAIADFVDCSQCIWAYMTINNIGMQERFGINPEWVIDYPTKYPSFKAICVQITINSLDSYALLHHKWVHIRRQEEWLDHLYKLKEELNDK
jgi:2-iminoacetate synthase ThiH